MAWKVELDHLAKRDINKLDRQVAIRILKFLNDRLSKAADPRMLGESLKGKLEEYWKYRVGSYKIICSISDNTLTVIVIKIGNRREVYREK